MLTIILYLILGALLGSLVSKVEESSQAMMPAMMLGIIGFYVLISGMASPDTMLIKVFHIFHSHLEWSCHFELEQQISPHLNQCYPCLY